MAIVIKTLSDSSQARADLSNLRKSVEGIQKSTEGFAQKFTRIGNAIAYSAAAASSAYGIIKLSDAITNLDNRLNSVSRSAADAKAALGAIYDISLRTRTSVSSISELFTKMTLVSKDLGANQAQIAQVTNTISEGFKISGASAENARAAIVQLSQAFASGKLAGDEFNSVLENAPFLAQRITEGMGITLGQLYKLRDEGKLFAKDVFAAILKQQDKVHQKFQQITVTFSDAFTNMKNSLFILAKTMSETILGSNGFGLAETINNWALGIAEFAKNFRFYLLKAKTEAILFAIDVTSFFTDMWDTIVKDGPDAIFDFFARLPSILQDMLSGVQPYAQRLAEIILSYANAIYTASSVMFFNFLQWLRKSERTAGLADVLESMNNRILEIGRRTAAYFNSLDFSGLYDRLTSAVEAAWDFIKNYDYSQLWDRIVRGMTDAFAAIREIDVSRFFPSLKTALATIKRWAEAVVHWFWWIYNEVIGNSYIPDLIEGILKWSSKLMGGPLGFFKKFSVAATAALAAIKFTGVKGFSLLPKLLGGASVLTAGAYAFRKQLGLEEIFTKFGGNFTKGFHNVVQMLIEGVSKMLGVPAAFADAVGKWWTEPLKILERNPVTKNVSEKTYKRNLLADQLHIPRDAQVPIATSITALVVAGILAFMNAGTTRSVVISLFTTGALVGVSRAIDQDLIKEFAAKVTAFLLGLLNKGINALLGKAVSEDPFGFLVLVAKFSLLFKAGREYFLGLAKTLATAPTTLGSNVANLVTVRALGGELKLAENRLSKNMLKLDNQVVKSEGIFGTLVNNVANQRNRAGQLVGQQRAQTLVQQAAADPHIFARSSPEVQQAARQLQFTDSLRTRRDQVAQEGAAQVADKRRVFEDQERKRFERVQAAKEGFTNFGAGVGGVLGTAVGFQVGANKLDELKKERQAQLVERLQQGNLTIGGQAVNKDTAQKIATGEISIKDIDGAGKKFAEVAFKEFEVSAWEEIGYTIGGAAAGQAIGSLVGSLAAGGAIFIAEKVGALALEGIKLAGTYVRLGLERAAAIANGILMAAPLLLVPALIVAAVLAAAYLIYKYWDQIKAFLIAAGQFIVNLFISYVNLWKSVGAWIVDKFVKAWDLLKVAAKFLLDAFMDPMKWWTETFPNIVKNAFKWITEWWDKEDPKTPPPAANDNQAQQTGGRGVRRADGGLITGPGTGRSDSILARLSNGEFVVNADATRKNRGLLEALNSGQIPGYKDGGTVGTTPIVVNGRQEQRRADFIGAKILSVQDDIKRLQEGAAKTQSSILRDAANRQIKELQRFVADSSNYQSLLDIPVNSVLKNADGTDATDANGKKIRAARDAKDTGGLKFADELSKINELFPKLALSMTDFLKLNGEARAQLFELIQPILKNQKRIEDAAAGSGQAFDIAKIIEGQKAEAAPEAQNIVDVARSSANAIQPRLSQSGIELSIQELQTFTPEFMKQLLDYVIAQEEWAKTIEANALDPAKVNQIRQLMNQSTTAISEAIADQTALTTKDPFAIASVKLERAGVSVSRDAFNRMRDVAQAQIVALADRVIALQKAINSGTLSQTARLSAQAEIDANAEKINELAKSPIDRAKAAGEDFTGKMRDSFSDGMFNFIRKGKFNLLNIASTFVDNIVRNFTDSLANNLFQKGSLLGGITDAIGRGSVLGDTAQTGGGSGLGGLLGGFGKLFGKSSGGIAGVLQDKAPIIGEDVAKPIVDIAPKIGTDIGGEISKSVGGLSAGGAVGLAGIGGSLFGMLLGSLFNEGGEVSGPGTSTSDSIPARLSNGEFVIKAKQVKKYRPLINAINDDNIPKFADGGLVGKMDSQSIEKVTGIAPVSVSNDNSKAVVNNIAITGDISKQTKKEIYGMIPQIAAGVNSYNREKGIK